MIPALLWLWACAAPGSPTGTVTETASPEPPPPGAYEHLLLFDLTSGARGKTAGADIDAVQLKKQSGELHWADSVVDSALLGADNEHVDPSHALGESDSDCDENVFASLGGAGGFLLLSFGDGVRVENGDIITVYEVGSVMCPGAADERWEIGALDGTDLVDMNYIGQAWGMDEIGVNTL